MQQYTVYLHLQTAQYVSGGISTHHLELISLYLPYPALLRPLLLPAVSMAGWERQAVVTVLIMSDTVDRVL